MKKFFCGFLWLILFPSAVLSLEVGSAKEKITPSLSRPVWLAGFQPNRPARGIHDELWARSLVFSHNKTVIALCAIDCLGILHYDLWKVRKRVAKKLHISPNQVIISATHTHSGPDTIGIWGGSIFKSGKDPLYFRKLQNGIFRSLVRAYQNRKPARIRSAQIKISSVLKDSRYPKVMDPMVTAIQAVDSRGKTLATLVNYAMHPEVLTGRNSLITSDYPHYLRKKMEETFGGICIFNVGPIGGMQTPKARKRTFQEAKRIGEILANGAIEALKKTKFYSTSTCHIQTTRVFFPLTNIKFILGVYAGLLGKNMRREMFKQSKILPLWNVPADLSVMEIGHLQIATLPGEAFPELGFVVKKWMKGKQKMLIGLANNEAGYIFAPSQWTKTGYEETMSLGPQTAPAMMKGLKFLVVQSNGRLGRK